MFLRAGPVDGGGVGLVGRAILGGDPDGDDGLSRSVITDGEDCRGVVGVGFHEGPEDGVLHSHVVAICVRSEPGLPGVVGDTAQRQRGQRGVGARCRGITRCRRRIVRVQVHVDRAVVRRGEGKRVFGLIVGDAPEGVRVPQAGQIQVDIRCLGFGESGGSSGEGLRRYGIVRSVGQLGVVDGVVVVGLGPVGHSCGRPGVTAAWPGPTSGCRADRSRVKVEASDLVMAPEFVADDLVTVCCAWASGPDQEAELERQQSVMSAHCSAMGCRVLTLCNASGDGVGPGMRDLLGMIVRRRVQRLVVADGQHFRASVPGS